MRIVLFIVFAFLAPALASAQDASKPNILVIWGDDIGYWNVSYNNDGMMGYLTPNIDRIANEGMRFTDFYSGAPVCSASRAALLTGSYCDRAGVTDVLFPNRRRQGLHPDEQTVAEVLQGAGYATACIGKWHLGDEPQFLPTRQGFDRYFGIPYSNDMSIARDGKKGPPLMRDEEIVEHPAEHVVGDRPIGEGPGVALGADCGENVHARSLAVQLGGHQSVV